MATQEKTWNVANRLHSMKDSDKPELNHIIAGADEIYDDTKAAKQSDINAQTDAALAGRYTKSETYSKEQLDSLITTPDVNYVTVATFADLPQTGEADTIYRVSSYDGTQVDASKYALYAWNGTAYQLLAVRSAVGEVFDVSEYNSGATYETLAAALAAVPVSVQRGGMSIKFILRTNTGTDEEPVYKDEYVQYRLMAVAWSNNVSNWQGIDDEPTAGSSNLVKSGGVAKKIYIEREISLDLGDNYISEKYITGNGNLANGGALYNVYYFQCQKGDKFTITANINSSSARLYAIYNVSDIESIGSSSLLAVGPVCNTTEGETVEVTHEAAQLIAVQYYSRGSMSINKVMQINKLDLLNNSMFANKDWQISSVTEYDGNEIPIKYNIIWSDGTAGTVVLSNINDDVLEYQTITATYLSKVITYSISYDDNGYIMNENYNIN